MPTEFAVHLCEEINFQTDAVRLLELIDFHGDKLQISGHTIKAFCPVHQDSRFRSLLVDTERKAFRCTIKTCAGYEGGSLLDLYALSKNCSVVTAAYQVATKLELTLLEGWPEQLAESYLNDAAAAKNQGDITQADALLKELIEIMPTMPEPRMELATLMLDLGEIQAATDAYSELIDTLTKAKEFEKADRVAEQAMALFPDNEDIQFARVKIAEDSGNKTQIIDRMLEIVASREQNGRQLDNIGLLEQLVLKAPYEPEYALKLAGLYEQQHNVRGASRQYENAARTYMASGNTAAGIEMLERVVQFNSENMKARLDLAMELANFGDMDRAREHTFKAVNQQIDQQEFGTAVRTVEGWLQQEPDNIDARELLARIYMDQERSAEAAEYLVEGAGIAGESGDHSRSADLLLRAKFLLPDAIELREKLIAAFTANHEEQRAGFEIIDLAEILFSADRQGEAVAMLVRGLGYDLSVPLKLQIANSLANNGHADDALKGAISLTSVTPAPTAQEAADIYELLSRLDPDNLDYHLNLLEALWPVSPGKALEAAMDSANGLISRDNAAEAEIVLERVSSRVDGYYPAIGPLIDTCLGCERIDLAGHIYQLTIQEFAEQDAEGALRIARRIAEIDPHHASAQSDIAHLLASLGRAEEASRQYVHVAAQLRQAGDYENALGYAQAAAELNPNSVGALAVQAVLSRSLSQDGDMKALADQLISATRQAGDPDDVATGYLAYTELFPDDDAALDEAETALKNLAAPNGVARIMARKASRLSAGGNWSEAAKVLHQASEVSPDLPDIAEQYGEAANVVGDKDTAALAYSAAAHAYHSQHDSESARRCAEYAATCSPESIRAHEAIFSACDSIGLSASARVSARWLALHQEQKNSANLAARWAREWVRLSVDDPESYLTLGRALFNLEQSELATEAFSSSARHFLKAERYADSLAALEQIDQLGPLSVTDQGTLEAIRQNSKIADEQVRADLLIARNHVEAGQLDQAREIAAQLSGANHHELASELWTLIAGRDINANSAARAYAQAAQAYESLGNTPAAVSSLKAALEISGDRPELHAELAEILRAEGQLKEALPHYLTTLENLPLSTPGGSVVTHEKIIEYYGGDVDSLTAIGKRLLKIGRTAEAIAELERAATVALEQKNTTALISICSLDDQLTRQSRLLTSARADALMGMENAQQALDWVKSTSKEQAEAGKYEEALEMTRRWLSMDSEDLSAHRLLIRCLRALKKSDESAAAHLALARLLADSGNAPEALIEIEASLSIATGTPGLQQKAELLQAMEQPEQAAAVYQELAAALIQEDDPAGAGKAIKTAVNLDPANAGYQWLQAEFIRETKGISAGLPAYRRWLALRKGAVPEAEYIGDIEKVCALVPDNAGLLEEYTDALIKAGRGIEAAPHLQKLSAIQEQSGDFNRAAETLELILHHSGGATGENLEAIGRLYEKGSSPARAQDHYRTAARVYTEVDAAEKAIGLLEKVVKLSEDSPLPEDYAILARTCSRIGNQKAALKHLDKALKHLAQVSGNINRRETLLKQALEIAPLNADYVLNYMDLIAPGRAMTEGLRASRQMNAAGVPEDAVKVITRLITLAPHDMSLRQELIALASDAVAAGDVDASQEALNEAVQLATEGSHHRALAEVFERARSLDDAAKHFVEASLLFAAESKSDLAVSALNRAVSAKPSAVDADQMSELVHTLGAPVHDVAREQLRSALTARKQKQSQVLALALLDTMPFDRAVDVLRTIYTLGGSSFVVSIANQRLKTLKASAKMDEAVTLVTAILQIAPDAPDAWHLAARVYNENNKRDDARRAALEAARLYQITGAIMEEEESYREAITAAPGDLTIQTTLADYLVRENRAEEAVETLQDLVETARSQQNSDMLLDSLQRAVQIAPANTDLREKLARELETIAPDSAIANWLETARLFTQDGSAEKALVIYQHVLEMNPRNETALQELVTEAQNRKDVSTSAGYTQRLADIKAARKQYGDACKLLQTHLELDPDNLAMLEQLSAMAGTSNNQEVFNITTRALALKLQKLGQHEDALRQFEIMVERNPKDARLLISILDCCAASGDQEKALVYAQQLLAVAKETEDPERVRLAAATILNYREDNPEAHYDLAEALLSLNRVPEAVAEWTRAGEYYESNGNTAAAYTCYKKITQINPTMIHAWRRMADIALSIGDVETGRSAVMHVLDKSRSQADTRTSNLLVRLLDKLPDDPEVHRIALDYYTQTGAEDKIAREYLWLSDHTFELGNSAQAESFINEGLRLLPDNAQLKERQHSILKQLGRLEELQVRLRREATEHEKAGDLENASRVLRDLVQIAPNQIGLQRELVRLLEKLEQNDEAFEHNLTIIRLLLDSSELEEARDLADSLAKKHKDYRFRERIADLLAESAYPDVAARHYLNAAKTAVTKKQPDDAISLIHKAVLARPSWPESRRTLAETLDKANRPDEAFEAWIGLTEALLENGEFTEATATLDKLAQDQPDRLEVREQLASLYERTGHPQQQIEVLKELLSIYEAQNNEPKLLAISQKLIAAQPDDPELLTRYVELLSQHNNRPDDLLEDYARLADLLARRGDYEAAFQTYEQILGLAPDSTSARSRYATFLMSRGSRNRALSEMRVLAEQYSQRKDHSAAVDVLNAALAISPRDADLCLALAKEQEAAGMLEDARISYARATAILASTAAVKGIDTYRRILSQDEQNTAVRLRLVELLINCGDKMEAAREARVLAEIHISRGELAAAEYAYSLVDQCEPSTVDEIRMAVSRDSYDPSLQYIHYVRLGKKLMDTGSIDDALDIFRTARSLHDDEPEIIQKCIECVSLIAPEAEAIPDYLLMAEKLLMTADYIAARKAYEQVRLIDPFNNDARCGLEAVTAAERSSASRNQNEDSLVLKAGRTLNKRVALMDLLVACQEAAVDNPDKKLGA